MKKSKLRLNNILFLLFCVLLIIPQTRSFIQIGLNKIKVAVWSPSIEAVEDQNQLPSFTYAVTDLMGNDTTFTIGNGKVMFISYWATWCPPCLAELPSIQSLYKAYGDRVIFLLLTTEDPVVVTRFMRKKGYELPVYFSRMDTPAVLKERTIPTNFVINAQGKIIIKETGAANWNSTKVRVLLDGLLEE